ncbi:MAG: hypothetical protein ABIL07_07030, partial [candidate division WOR-3 bacterium]
WQSLLCINIGQASLTTTKNGCWFMGWDAGRVIGIGALLLSRLEAAPTGKNVGAASSGDNKTTVI